MGSARFIGAAATSMPPNCKSALANAGMKVTTRDGEVQTPRRMPAGKRSWSRQALAVEIRERASHQFCASHALLFLRGLYIGLNIAGTKKWQVIILSSVLTAARSQDSFTVLNKLYLG